MNRKTFLHTLGIICLALLMASCRRLSDAGPVGAPTLTPTPRSTPLPQVPTAIPLGTTINPLHMKIVKPDTDAPLDSAITALQKALLASTKMTVDVELVDGDAEGLAALCASPSGTVTAAWLSGLAYAAAYAQNCGSALLQVERDARSTGDQSRIIVKSDSKFNAIADLSGANFCRLGYTDLYSWLIPLLMLKAGSVADTDLKSITDYTDPTAMIADVAAGKCDAAGIAGSQFDQLATSDQRTAVRVLQQSVTIPYEVLVVPGEIPLGQQKQLSDALVSIANGTQGDTIKPLLNQDQLDVVNDDGLGELRSFITRSGIDLSQAGT